MINVTLTYLRWILDQTKHMISCDQALVKKKLTEKIAFFPLFPLISNANTVEIKEIMLLDDMQKLNLSD